MILQDPPMTHEQASVPLCFSPMIEKQAIIRQVADLSITVIATISFFEYWWATNCKHEGHRSQGRRDVELD